MHILNKYLHSSYNLLGSILDAEDSVVKMTKTLPHGLNSSDRYIQRTIHT